MSASTATTPGPVLRVLLGSVSTQLIQIAPCPVLVIPRPDPAAG
ncbi:MAG TPA: universal stress protein [Solirubrobacterales bacterium]|nr:universal stress protein [Solirubrobacterales bacterium]